MARILTGRDLLWLLVVGALGIGYWRETDVRLVMPASSMDPKDILRRAQKGISENPSPQ